MVEADHMSGDMNSDSFFMGGRGMPRNERRENRW
jgi:hypothetical protein